MPYTWLQFKNAVKGLMTDAPLNDTAAVRAIAEYVKSKIALEVDKNPNLSESYLTRWTTERGRLLGYAVTLNASSLRAEVDKLITVDSNRHGIGDFIDDVIEQAVNDLTGSATFVDRSILQAVIDIQHYIDFYRGLHTDTFATADLTDSGETSVGSMPAGCTPLDGWYVETDTCSKMPVVHYPWEHRNDLICGSPKMNGGEFYVAFKPDGSQFMLFPPIMDADHVFELHWDGIKTDFEDVDTVPFDDLCAKAVAQSALAEMYIRPASLNRQQAAIHASQYQLYRRQLAREARSRRRFRYTSDSPSGPSNSDSCDECAVE